MAQNLKNIPEVSFIGMNNRDKPELLKKGYVQKALNCILGDGQIVKGPGTVEAFDISGVQSGCLGAISTDAEVYFAANNAEDTLAIIYRWTGSGAPTPVASMTASLPIEFVDAGTAVYALNGTNAVIKLDGATATTPAGIPIGKYGYWINNRLYISGVTSFPSRLYFSGANTPDTFGGSDYLDVFPSQRGDITGLGSLAGLLMVGKKNNWVSFNGYTVDDFTAKQLVEQQPNIGLISQRSIVNTGNDMYYLSFLGDVPHIRSLKQTSFGDINDGGVISNDIEGTMKTINKSMIHLAVGGYDGRFLWYAIPTGSSTFNDLVICLDTVSEGWTIHDSMDVAVFFRSSVSGQDRLYYGDSQVSKAYYLDRTRADRANNALSMEVISRKYRPAVSQKSKYKYLYTMTGADTQGDITISASPDGFTYEEQDVLSPSVSGSSFPITFPFQFGESDDMRNRTDLAIKQSYSCELKFTETSTQQAIISEWDLYYYTRGLRST